jgi:PAS domain-containing protein
MKFNRPSPLIQMTMALVALCSTLVILGSLFLDTMPDRGAQERAVRKAVGEALAVQLAEMLRRDDPREIERAMTAIVARTDGLRSVGVRRTDGTLVLGTAAHVQGWKQSELDASRPEQVTVPLSAEGQRWGRVEMAFAADDTHPVLAFFKEPLVQMLLFLGVAGWLVFGLYMRRALQHLDPASVVPERVQGAFDAMAEGVVVLDSRGRVMLSNKAFRTLHPELAAMPTGSSLGTLPWLSQSLPEDAAQHPWARAMTERRANAGTALEAGHGADKRQLVINADMSLTVTMPTRRCARR